YFFLPFILFLTLQAQCHYTIDATLDPKQHQLTAEVTITDTNRSHIRNLEDFPLTPGQQPTQSLHFSYEKTLPGSIEEDFIFLGNAWLPQNSKLCTYELHVTLPEGFIAVSESEEETVTHNTKEQNVRYTFKMSKPIDHINLIASKDFVVHSQTHHGITVSTYLFKKHAHLASTYIDKVIHYIDEYESLLGSFPYTRFSVVENSFQTGYSMPTFTLIGDKIIDKPFLLDVSLGHEIVHQWFGNSVFNDFNQGNWVEGLSTYLADHYYSERKAQGWQYRKNLLENFAAYVHHDNLTSLSDFKQRTDRASMAIGYGKGAFAFHTLRRYLGDDALFFDALKAFYQAYRFQYATYADIADFFTRYTQKDCTDIIHNMFEHHDIIHFKPTSMSLGYENGHYRLHINVPHDQDKHHGYQAPFVVKTTNGEENFLVTVEGDTNITLPLKHRPVELIFDRDYDLFRTLSPKESTPNIAKLIADEHLLVVTGKDWLFTNVQSVFSGATQIRPHDLTFLQMQQNNILFLSDARDLAEKSLPNLHHATEGFIFQVERNPWSPRKVVAYSEASSPGEAMKAAGKVSHYGTYSFLHFQNGQLKAESILPTQRGSIFPVSKEKQVVRVPKNQDFNTLMNAIEDKKVVFVGEAHTTYVHHVNQLEIIKALHRQGKKVAIGMEMFQRKFQPVLDDYIAKKIDEKTFLQRSEYFIRWKYNYNLYKPIMEYARENGIPVVALNLEKEIVKKVTKNGLYALSDDEKAMLPETLDFTDGTYRNHLNAIFSANEHIKAMQDKNSTAPNNDFLYQSQILWEETMAATAATYLQTHHVDTFVVLAGVGHIINHHGIPKRLHRRLNLPYSIIVQDMPTVENSADFILYTNQMQVKEPLKLGVMLDTAKQLKVLSVLKDSLASTLGIQKGDTLLALDDQEIPKLETLKFLLFFKKKTDPISIKLQRGDRIITISSE
ncbi:MAG: hypothetical protein DSZ03_00115, partial [Sulfurimonas sp.]